MRIEEIAKKKGCYVNSSGDMFGIRGYKASITPNKDGYSKTKIRINGKLKNLYIHRLQAYQKYGIKLYNKGIVVRHLNGNPGDNSLDNILIGTQSENMLDIPKDIRMKTALHATSFVRKYNRKEVKLFHSIDNSYKKTMDEFGISSKGTLHYILNS